MRTILSVFVFLILPQAASAQAFTRIQAGAFGSGQPGGWSTAWADYNNDGWPDLLVIGQSNQLYRNNGNGSFNQVVVDHLTTTNLSQNSATWADVDNDGDTDVYVSHLGPGTPVPPGQPLSPRLNFLYLNDGPPAYAFSRVTSGALTSSLNMTWTSTFSDPDRDGDLDLVAWGDQGDTDLYYENDGEGQFTRSTDPAFLDPGEFSAGGQFVDMDGDGDEDVLVVNFRRANNELYRNMLVETGQVSYERILTGDLVRDFEDDLVASWGDTDNDGDLDVFMSVWANRNNTFYRNDGDLTFTRIRTGPHVSDGGLSLGNALFDFDNDGHLDLYVTDQQGADKLYRNNGDGTFSRVLGGEAGHIVTQSISGADSGGSIADFDNDGDLDVAVATSGGAHKLYRNDIGNQNNWIQLTLRGTASNTQGIGAIVRAKAQLAAGEGAQWQMRFLEGGPTGDRGQSLQRIHFGLGAATTVDSLTIQWPSGTIDVLTDVEVNRFMTVTEGSHPVSTSVETGSVLPAASVIQNLWPNPARESAFLSVLPGLDRSVTWAVVDMLGRTRSASTASLPGNGHGELTVDLSGLESGLYYIRVMTGRGTGTVPVSHVR